MALPKILVLKPRTKPNNRVVVVLRAPRAQRRRVKCRITRHGGCFLNRGRGMVDGNGALLNPHVATRPRRPRLLPAAERHDAHGTSFSFFSTRSTTCFPDRAAILSYPHFVPGLPHVVRSLQSSVTLISYQDYHMLSAHSRRPPRRRRTSSCSPPTARRRWTS